MSEFRGIADRWRKRAHEAARGKVIRDQSGTGKRDALSFDCSLYDKAVERIAGPAVDIDVFDPGCPHPHPPVRI